MVPLTSLWLPILLSAIAVFVASSIMHMVLPFHRSDYHPLPREDEFLDAFGKLDVPAGDYVFPFAGSPKAMKDPAFQEKWKRGPIGMMTVMVPEPGMGMGKSLGLWFVYCVVASLFAAYVAGHALQAGASFRQVVRFAGITAFASYALALWQNTIWFKRAWITTLKSNIDAVIYSLLTALIFGWLWPR